MVATLVDSIKSEVVCVCLCVLVCVCVCVCVHLLKHLPSNVILSSFVKKKLIPCLLVMCLLFNYLVYLFVNIRVIYNLLIIFYDLYNLFNLNVLCIYFYYL